MMTRKEDPAVDMHPADIKAAIEKRGLTFRKLALRAGYKQDSLKNVLRAPNKKYEIVVANALDMEPEEIWPSRWNERRKKEAS